MNRMTSQVSTRQMMMMSLGSGISLLKTALPMRVLTNSPAVPTSVLVCNPAFQAPRANDQKSPS